MDIRKILLRAQINTLLGGITYEYRKENIFSLLLEEQSFQYKIARNFFFFNGDGTPYRLISDFYKHCAMVAELEKVWKEEQLGEMDADFTLLLPVKRWMDKQLRVLDTGGTFGEPYQKNGLQAYWNAIMPEGVTLIARMRGEIKELKIDWHQIL